MLMHYSPLQHLFKLFIDALMIEKVKVDQPLQHLFKLLIDAARKGLHLLIHHNVVLVARIPGNSISLHVDKRGFHSKGSPRIWHRVVIPFIEFHSVCSAKEILNVGIGISIMWIDWRKISTETHIIHEKGDKNILRLNCSKNNLISVSNKIPKSREWGMSDPGGWATTSQPSIGKQCSIGHNWTLGHDRSHTHTQIECANSHSLKEAWENTQ